MSDEQRKLGENEEPEVEGHRLGAKGEPAQEGEDEPEVEGHIRLSNIRMD